MKPIEPSYIERTGDPTPVASLSQYVWRMSARHQCFIVLLALAVAVLSMAPLELQRRMINEAIEGADLNLLAMLALVYLGVLVLQGALKYALRLYQGWIAESTIRYCRGHLYSVHRNRRYDQADDNGDGQAVSVIGAEIEQLGGFVGEALSSPAVNGGMLAALFGYMLWVEPMIAGIAICFFLPQMLMVPWIQQRMNRLIDRRISMLRDLGDVVANDDMKHQGDGKPEDLEPFLIRIYRNRIRFFAWKFAGKALVNLLNALAPLSVLVVGGYLVIEGSTTIGVVVAFITGFERMASPMTELIAYYRLAQQVRVKHDKIAAWL